MEYTSFSGNGVITKWLKKLKNFDTFAESEWLNRLDILPALSNDKLWSMPEYRRMTNLKDIGEIRFQSKNKVQFRVFGFFLKEKQQYVMLIGAIEDNKKYDPTNAFDTALTRREDVLNEDVIIIEYKYNEEDN